MAKFSLQDSIRNTSMSKSSQAKNTSYNTRNGQERQPLPNRLVRLISEARWIAFAVLFVYFVMILLSYNKADPSWSFESTGPVSNLGGRLGANLADLMLYIFGF